MQCVRGNLSIGIGNSNDDDDAVSILEAADSTVCCAVGHTNISQGGECDAFRDNHLSFCKVLHGVQYNAAYCAEQGLRFMHQ
jgi:hypothetical protein